MMSESQYASRSALVVLLSVSLILTACGSPFQLSQSVSKSGENGNGGVVPNVPSQWDKLAVEGQVGGWGFPTVQVLTIDKVKKELIVRLPMYPNPYLDGFSLNIQLPKVPGAYGGIEALSGGGSALVFHIPLKYVLRGVDLLAPNKLPNGDPLPRIPDGELPSFAIQLPPTDKDIKVSLYFAVQTIGIFVNTPFNPYLSASIDIKNPEKTRTFGVFSIIPEKATPKHDGGFFLAVQLPDDIARIIDDNL